MKSLMIRSLLLPVLACLCFSQGKASVEGYVQLDGKPLRNAEIILGSMASHMQSADWLFPMPIVTSTVKGVVIVGETGNPPQEAPNWFSQKKTDKSGHFRVDVPVGMKIVVVVYAARWLPHLFQSGMNAAYIEKAHKIPCAAYGDVVPVRADRAVQNLRINLNSARTVAQGGCLANGDGLSMDPPSVPATGR